MLLELAAGGGYRSWPSEVDLVIGGGCWSLLSKVFAEFSRWR